MLDTKELKNDKLRFSYTNVFMPKTYALINKLAKMSMTSDEYKSFQKRLNGGDSDETD